jgi:hypothetical protein
VSIAREFLRVIYSEKPFKYELCDYIVSLYPDIAAGLKEVAPTLEFRRKGAAIEDEGDRPSFERFVKLKFRAVSKPPQGAIEDWIDLAGS